MARTPEMNYSMIMTTTRGMCDEMSALAVFAMRALGIPVTQDYTPKWPRSNIGHTWNSVYDSAGRHFSFMGTEAVPGIQQVAGGRKARFIGKLLHGKTFLILTMPIFLPSYAVII
jgi:hypothetical protein